MFCLLKMLTDGLECCGLFNIYYVTGLGWSLADFLVGFTLFLAFFPHLQC